VIWCSGEVEREWGSTVDVPGGFIGAGAGNGAGSALARRRGGRALASSERVEHVALCFCSSSSPY
jgi:transketolase